MARIDTIHSILQSFNSSEQVFKHNFPPKYFPKKFMIICQKCTRGFKLCLFTQSDYKKLVLNWILFPKELETRSLIFCLKFL